VRLLLLQVLVPVVPGGGGGADCRPM